jgi:hypothetical protein
MILTVLTRPGRTNSYQNWLMQWPLEVGPTIPTGFEVPACAVRPVAAVYAEGFKVRSYFFLVLIAGKHIVPVA